MNRLSFSFYRTLLWLWDWFTLNLVFFFISSSISRADALNQKEYIHFYYVFNLAWLASVYATALYLSKNWLSFESFFKRTLKSFMLTVTILFVFIFAYKFEFSRLFIFSCLISFAIALLINRFIFHLLVQKAKSKLKKKVVIIGNNEVTRKLIKYFRDESELGEVIACFSDEEKHPDIVVMEKVKVGAVRQESSSSRRKYFRTNTSAVLSNNGASQVYDNHIVLGDKYDNEFSFGNLWKREKTETAVPILGNLKDCLAFVQQNEVTEVYSTLSPELNPYLYELAHKAEEQLVHFKFVLDYKLFVNRSFHIDFVDNLPVLSLRSEPLEDTGNRIQKRLLDLIVSSMVTIFILSWLTPILAILIKLESRGPVFFKQLRSGKNNKPFWCIKFRSLRENPESDSKQVTKNDSRVTRLGRFMRKTNIDELPQFLNVLVGNMSVVGPRPHMLKHTEEFQAMYDKYMIRHFVKPGVTGLAQVKGYRGEIRDIELLRKRIEHDIYYLENWSLMQDFKIILSTIFVSFKGDKNAY
jgi:putative colanic acid biosysnthesis UDP-glucose lipid carrier transferase